VLSALILRAAWVGDQLTPKPLRRAACAASEVAVLHLLAEHSQQRAAQLQRENGRLRARVAQLESMQDGEAEAQEGQAEEAGLGAWALAGKAQVDK
jgi:hypothetical protein